MNPNTIDNVSKIFINTAIKISAALRQLMLSIKVGLLNIQKTVIESIKTLSLHMYRAYLKIETIFSNITASILLISWALRYLLLLIVVASLLYLFAAKQPTTIYRWMPFCIFVAIIVYAITIAFKSHNNPDGLKSESLHLNSLHEKISKLIMYVFRVGVVLISVFLMYLSALKYLNLPHILNSASLHKEISANTQSPNDNNITPTYIQEPLRKSHQDEIPFRAEGQIDTKQSISLVILKYIGMGLVWIIGAYLGLVVFFAVMMATLTTLSWIYHLLFVAHPNKKAWMELFEEWSCT